jgi:hypothetical protein
MKKLIALLLLLALPSIASAVESSGVPIRVPDTEADSASGPTPKSWLSNDYFYVRAHICRSGTTVCGPDPLVSSGFSFNAIVRLASANAFTENANLYFLITDSENAVVSIGGPGPVPVLPGFNNYFVTFALPDGLYRFISIVQGLSTGKVALSDYYRFRVGGPNSSGCCP